MKKKTIYYKGRRYKVVFTTGDTVVVTLPESMIYGYHSRMPIPLERLHKRVKRRVQRWVR